jgi:hypothetical protein
METNSRSIHVRLAFLVSGVLFVFFLYTFLHEAGHATIGLLFGETLTEFSVKFWDFSAHVNMSGGNLTRAQAAIQSLAGVALPLLIWMLFISFIPRNAPFTLGALEMLASMMVLNTLLAWIIIPVLYIVGSAPASDDVTYFLQYSEMPPLLLTLAASLLYILGWAYFFSKKEGRKNEFLLLRTADHETILSGARRTIPAMMGVLIVCAALTFMLNNLGVAKPPDQLSPPAGFVSVAELDLSTRAYTSETITEFSLDEPARVGVYITVRDINTSYFDLCIRGADGYRSVVLHGEGYSADQGGGLWEENLPSGTYRLVLTSPQCLGTASVFLKTH